MFTEKKESLCNSHDTIQYWARDIKKKLKKAQKENDYSSIPELLPVVDQIIQESRVAKKKGQRMENRLKKYYDSIISCGFRRIGR